MDTERYKPVYTDPRLTAKPLSAKGRPQVRLERKGRGGKVVTVLEGLARSEDELRALLKELQRLCGTGGTVKENHIELQGDFQAKVREFISKPRP